MDEQSEPQTKTPERLALEQAKERYGQVEIIEIKANDWQEAHAALGKAVEPRLHEVIREKISAMSPDQWKEQLKFVRGCQQCLRSKLDNPLIGKDIELYFKCLNAWGEGAQISKLIEDYAGKGYEQATTEELALLLQDDNVGCQTVMSRAEDGSIALMHSEEQPRTGSAEKPRLVKFIVGDKTRYSFIYPELLPGSAFSWSDDGGVMAIDALYTKTPEQPGSLANAAAWLLMIRDDRYQNAERIIESLGPYVDGYAVNMIRKNLDTNAVEAKRVLFMLDAQETKIMPTDVGTMYQGNVLEPDDALRPDYEETTPLVQQNYGGRLKRFKRVFGLLPKINPESGKGLGIEVMTRLLSHRVGGEFAIANQDVRAGAAVSVSERGMQVRIVSGPALREETIVKKDPNQEAKYWKQEYQFS